jgi:hypothetical protein
MKRRSTLSTIGVGLTMSVGMLGFAHTQALAQGRGNSEQSRVEAGVTISLSTEVRTQIRTFYTSRPETGVEALPPGIRRNLERGKPLPPGIAKKSAPQELQTQLHLEEGYELVEVGLDVLLVEVATGVIHDVLMDLIR